jgi:hypothetical protein
VTGDADILVTALDFGALSLAIIIVVLKVLCQREAPAEFRTADEVSAFFSMVDDMIFIPLSICARVLFSGSPLRSSAPMSLFRFSSSARYWLNLTVAEQIRPT